jgi:hypothetical protein
MFSFKRLWMTVPLCGLLASCSEDINVAAPYKPVTVIYGLLDIADTAQYIRIQKAFLDENKSALDMAQNADSNFYQDLEVLFQDYNDTARFDASTLAGEERLNRVDLAQEGFPKASGAFFNSPNFAYKTKRSLVYGHTYQLVVNNRATGESDTGRTQLINNGPPDFEVAAFGGLNYQLSFPALRSTDVFTIGLKPPRNSQIYEGVIRFNYVDSGVSSSVARSVDYRFATAARDNDTRVELTGIQRSFYTFLRDAMGPAPVNVKRFMKPSAITVWAGGRDLANYQTINNAQGGLTADQIKPIYTNIRGKNVYGLFSTRTRTVKNNAPISDITIDSLRTSPTVRELNIQGKIQ